MWIKRLHSPHLMLFQNILRYSKHKRAKIGFVFSQHIYPFIKVHTTIIFTLLKVQEDIIKIWHDLFIWFNLGFHSWISIDQPTINSNMFAWGMRTVTNIHILCTSTCLWSFKRRLLSKACTVIIINGGKIICWFFKWV